MARPDIVRSVDALRRATASYRRRSETVGLVPTMGALHEGHVALVERAHREADRTLVSIFVNPTQFAATEDLSRYPRTEEADLRRLELARADLVFIPSPEEMYPPGFSTTVSLSGPAKAGLEDVFRPSHFDGVATVVAKLFTQSGADVAVFGEKDYQQLLVVRQMAQDLDLGTRVVGHDTVREADGLALSSRNRFLSQQERLEAPLLHRTLTACANLIRASRPVGIALSEGREVIRRAGFKLDYLEARDARTLQPLGDQPGTEVRLLVAARLGTTRLIDNIEV
jgi:pantoate--beta-alanine ligase